MREDAKRQRIDKKRYVSEEVGLPTLNDILAELSKPGRDPRQQFEAFSFTEGVEKMEDLQPGQKLPGIVTNVTAFGAFVDIGVHQDGLVHISQLSDSFVKNPADVVKVGQRVMATVMEIDLPRKRIALSLKTKPELTPRSERGGQKNEQANPRDVRRFAHSNAAGPSLQQCTAALRRPIGSRWRSRSGSSCWGNEASPLLSHQSGVCKSASPIAAGHTLPSPDYFGTNSEVRAFICSIGDESSFINVAFESPRAWTAMGTPSPLQRRESRMSVLFAAFAMA